MVCPDWGEESLHWNDDESVGEQNVLPVVDGGDGNECADSAAGVSTTIGSAAVPAVGLKCADSAAGVSTTIGSAAFPAVGLKGVGGADGLEALAPASGALSSKVTWGV